MNKRSNIQLHISIASIIIAALSLALSTHVEYTYSKKHVEQQQIDAVMELVDSINHSPINYVLCAKTRSGYITKIESKTLFELSDTIKYQGNRNPIVMRNKDWRFSLTKFRFNPLIPLPIAHVLKEYEGEYEPCNFDIMKHQIYVGMGNELGALSSDFIVAREHVYYAHHDYYTLNNSAFIDTQTFVKTNLRLRKAIVEWLKSKNLEDINFGE